MIFSRTEPFLQICHQQLDAMDGCDWYGLAEGDVYLVTPPREGGTAALVHDLAIANAECTALTNDDFRVVCMGGSAGGLEAYLSILRLLPADPGMAFIVALHRGLEHVDLLRLILCGATAMPVTEVTQGMPLKPDCIFIMPPGKEMTIIRDEFHLQTRPAPRALPKTISVFLLSLAEAYTNRVVAIILSGMDHDGSAALGNVKAAGGVTFAQSDPKFDSMPHHAIATGYVDFVLPPADIARALLNLPAIRIPEGNCQFRGTSVEPDSADR